MRLKLKAHCECDDIIRIGRVIENEVTEIEFDFSKWQTEYGAGGATVLVLRNHDANPYPVALVIENGKALWTITDADTAVFGRGCFQLKYIAGTKVKMSKIFQFTCGKSLTGEGDAPDPYEDWLDTLTDLGTLTTTNAQTATAAATAAQASAASAAASATAAWVAQTAAEVAQGAAEAAQSAAETAQGKAETAQAAAQSALAGMTFVGFSVDADGHVLITNSDLLGTTEFELTESGHMEVTY